MDKRNTTKMLACAVAFLPLIDAGATTLQRPGTWCYQADAGPEATDLHRYLNCAWNHVAGFDTDETPFAFLVLRDIMIMGQDHRVRFPVCGFPGTGINSGGDCGWVDADVVYQNNGMTISGQLPLIDRFLSIREERSIPFTRVPKDIALKLTMPDGRVRTVEFSILEERLPETRADGLPFDADHALHGLSEFEPGQNDSPTPPSPADPAVHGDTGHSSYMHSIHCLVAGSNAPQ